MSSPAIIPLEITRGNDAILLFQFEDENFESVDVSDDAFVFRAVDSDGNEVWRKATTDLGDECVIVGTDTLKVWITYEDSRDATARKINYAVEHRAGSPEIQTTTHKGQITLVTDANDDV